MHKIANPIIERVFDEGKQLFWIFIYFLVVLGAFSVFRSLALNERNLIYHQGFALFNALLLAKVVLTAEFFHVADNFKHKPLVYPIVYRSGVFCVLLLCFYIAEETLVGIWQGKTIVASFPSIGGGSWKGVLVVGAILFVGLIPFFAYRELARALGKAELHSLVFTRGTDALIIRSPQVGQGEIRARPRTHASNE